MKEPKRSDQFMTRNKFNCTTRPRPNLDVVRSQTSNESEVRQKAATTNLEAINVMCCSSNIIKIVTINCFNRNLSWFH